MASNKNEYVHRHHVLSRQSTAPPYICMAHIQRWGEPVDAFETTGVFIREYFQVNIRVLNRVYRWLEVARWMISKISRFWVPLYTNAANQSTSPKETFDSGKFLSHECRSLAGFKFQTISSVSLGCHHKYFVERFG